MQYIDITDLLLFVRKSLKKNSVLIPTGIERVMLEFMYYGVTHGQSKCIYYSSYKKQYLQLDRQTIVDIYNSNIDAIKHLQNIDVNRLNLLRIFVRYRNNPIKIIIKSIIHLLSSSLMKLKWKSFVEANNLNAPEFKKDDTILFLCAPGIMRKVRYLRHIKQQYALKMMMLIYDIMPITLDIKYLPSMGLRSETDALIRRSTTVIDKYLTSTHYCRKELSNYLASFNVHIPISVIPFGFGRNDVPDVNPPVNAPFVLMVSTIEVRKNHITLVKAWHELLRRGRLNGHKLVIVGKWGWKSEDVREYLEQNPDLMTHIVILNRVKDAELVSLYKHCAFTVFPSIAEGHGLPIVESLYYGKLCIASNTTSMEEVGGKLCEYISPFNLESLIEKMSFYLNNRDDLQERNNEISKQKMLTWNEASREFYKIIKEC